MICWQHEAKPRFVTSTYPTVFFCPVASTPGVLVPSSVVPTIGCRAFVDEFDYYQSFGVAATQPRTARRFTIATDKNQTLTRPI